MDEVRETEPYDRRQWAMTGEFQPSGALQRPVRDALLSPDERRLLRQQEWLWSADATEGRNLLSDYGFELSSDGHAQCFELAGSASVWICDAAVIYCLEDRGAVVLRSPQPAASLLPPEAVSLLPARETVRRARVSQLPADRDHLSLLVPPLMAWIGAYERWVLDTAGVAYRRRCLEEIDFAVCAAEEAPARWWDAASRWRELLRDSDF